MVWLFLLAYTCSGVAGLVYEVAWTRLLSLHIGHTTAAASAVVAAFMGGLASGAAAGGALATRLSRRHSLIVYAALEIFVGAAAVVLPWELAGLTPILAWAYADGAPGLLFPAVRLLACLALVFVPAAALGATFPLAIRWFAGDPLRAARSSSLLYAANTTGASIGALLAGFVLIPRLGIAATTRTGLAAGAIAAMCVLAIVLIDRRAGDEARGSGADAPAGTRASARPGKSKIAREEAPAHVVPAWLAGVALALSGFASLAQEIVWTRILSLVLGPTIYAFSATLAAVIAGVALGSSAGTAIVARTRRPAVWLTFTLVAGAVATCATSWLAGGYIPRSIAQEMAASPGAFDRSLLRGILIALALLVPTAACLGAAFPLALAIANDPSKPAAGRFGTIYAVNTVGAVLGSLAAGFALIPWLGLQHTLTVVAIFLVAAALAVARYGLPGGRARTFGIATATAAAVLAVFSPPWNRELLASGAYLYAPFVPRDLDLEPLLEAGTLLYYEEGAGATISVKRLTGTTTLAVDGKVDASNRSDMVTQKLIAHLPLLLHERPEQVAIIGLGSGVTAGAALRHPVSRVDVIEISPEVVEASRFFEEENQHALADPRTHLIAGDGRSHLLLSNRRYDVIVSEPSNPWIAGVASLFTREFFLAARDRLAPGGLICQWANAYTISDADLRTIVATFTSVFPQATVWLVGTDDVLLVAGADPDEDIEARLGNINRHWTRTGVAEDLASISANGPFALLSLFAGGPAELARYGHGAPILTDDRISLEFSAPLELHRQSTEENTAALTALLPAGEGPPAVRAARETAGAAEWRNRGAMLLRADAFGAAYDDYIRALTIDRSDRGALDGLVRTATASGRSADALSWLQALTLDSGGEESRPQDPADRAAVLVARSKLLASTGRTADALDAARQAAATVPVSPASLEQLASLHADAGDVAQLDAILERLKATAPDAPATMYYAAVSALLKDRPADTVRIATELSGRHPSYAPTYDLLGAAHTKLDQVDEARQAFERSLAFDAHDSTAYTNLGLLALASGDRRQARRYFAEALWLAPASSTAREGLARSK